MAQYEVELIVLKQLSGYLATPMFIVDEDGGLLFYNETAEAILGRRYEETGEMPLEEWSTMFVPMDGDGKPIPPERLPLVIAVQERKPALDQFWITGMDGVRRHIAVSALPIEGLRGRRLGSVAMLWELAE